MRKALIPGLTFATVLAFASASAIAEENQDARADGGNREATVARPDSNVVAIEETPTRIFLTREELEKATARQPLARRTQSPLMTWHGGPILVSSAVQSIFWGPSWNNSSFYRDKVSGLDSFYQGFGGSNYAGTSTEYAGSNGTVTRASAFNGHLFDYSNATGGNKTSPILAEVCKEITNPVANGYYPVYTDVPRGHAGYCAWHSWGSCHGTPIQFAFFFDLDGDPGCDPQSAVINESQGLAALANVSAHELSEARTDPQGTGWYDSAGAENGDKCAWTFNVPSVSLSNGSQWKLQGEWSNAAYSAGTGYPNGSGQKGCRDGH